MSHTLLSYLRARVVVDVDSMDPSAAARHTGNSAREKFCDMTSNQAIVRGEISKPNREDILKAACQTVKDSAVDVERQVADVVDLVNVLLAKQVYPYLTGRVLVQTSPSVAYDTEGTIAHAKKLVALFEAQGIPAARVCIKIPATPESMVACQYLEKVGIRTLATCLFSLPQALAASQAGCLYVAPYFNELRVHFQPGLWKDYKDTATEHPMAPVISSIVKTFKGIGSKTLVMPASIVTAAEAIAIASLGPDHLTLAPAVLDQLAAADSPTDPPEDPQPQHPSVSLTSTPANGPTTADKKEPSTDSTDFLGSGAGALREALAADAEATRLLADALKIFGEMEQKTQALIQDALAG